MKNRGNGKIAAELLASFLDGRATAQECREVLGSLSEDAELRELLHISRRVDTELGVVPMEGDALPMMAMAATCNEENYCCLECEKYILRQLGIAYDDDELLASAIRNGWQREEGTALHNVGRHLEGKGVVVTRRYRATIEELCSALDAGDSIIVAVDGGELLGCRIEELREDIFVGSIPDHTVVVVSCDADRGVITLYDPNSQSAVDSYALEQFADAWQDSSNYMVVASRVGSRDYTPCPIDLSDVELPAELCELREAIAENAHEVWAQNRWREGWRYGPRRDDELRQSPDMVPYSQLTEGEKSYDREMAMNTIKLLTKLGYDIVKREK